MAPNVRRALFSYAVVVILAGILSVLYSPGAGFGYHAAAKSGLIAGLVAGGLSLLWGALVSPSRIWPLGAAFATTLVFLAAFGWRMYLAWSAVAAGEEEKWFAAALISIMTVASLVLLMRLLAARSR